MISVEQLEHKYKKQFSLQSSEFCLCFILSGSHSIRIRQDLYRVDDRILLFLHPENLLFIEGCGEVLIIIFDELLVSELINLSSAIRIRNFYKNLMENDSPVLFSISFTDIYDIKRSILEIIRELTDMDDEYIDVCKFLFLGLLTHIKHLQKLTAIEQKQLIEDRHVWTISDVVLHIREEMDRSFSLEELSTRCNLNPSYFSRLFKQETGIPLFEFINRVRIEKACTMLSRTEVSVLDIAYSVGYNNVSHFNRYFRRLKEMSPMDYRRRYR